MGAAVRLVLNGGAFLGFTKILKEQGHTIIKIPWWMVKGLPQAARKGYNEELKRIIKKEKPDVYVCSKGYKNGPVVYPETTKFIQKHSGITVYLSQDDPFFVPTFVRFGMHQGYKIALTCSRAAFPDYKKLGLKPYLFWPAFDPELRKVHNVAEDKKIDFTFVGSPYLCTDVPRRRIVLEMVKAGMSVRVYGDPAWVTNGSTGLLGGHPRIKEYYGGKVVWQKVHDYYSKSRLNLSNHVCKADMYLNDRVPMVLGVGAFLFLDRIPGLDQVFVNKKHVVYYNDLNDLMRKARFYKNNLQERSRIAQAGRSLVNKRHTYYNRAHQFLRILRAHGIK